jgi:hypothetical protein
MLFTVRTGLGTVSLHTGEFSDEVEQADRVPRQHAGWQSVRYKGKRYQFFGGIRTSFFIDLSNPIRSRKA